MDGLWGAPFTFTASRNDSIWRGVLYSNSRRSEHSTSCSGLRSIKKCFIYTENLSCIQGFHWKNKTRGTEAYCLGRSTCQKHKDRQRKPLGTQQLLQISNLRWGSVAMNFIVHLHKTPEGYGPITTFVDKLTKRVRIILFRDFDTAEDVAKCFFGNVFWLHGLPESIGTGRESKFRSRYWRKLMRLFGVKFKMPTSKNNRMNGATEIMNGMISNYLGCYYAHRQRDSEDLIAPAEFAYLPATIESLGVSPFKANTGW